MVNVLIRDVPDEVHEGLRDRAEREGQSLQQYLQAELARLAAQPSVAEVLDRIEARSGGAVGLQQAVDDLARERP
jgi:plasmid stability protein